MVIRLWCDEEQIEKVRKLPSCNRIEKSQVGTATYIVFGNEDLLSEIDAVLK